MMKKMIKNTIFAIIAIGVVCAAYWFFTDEPMEKPKEKPVQVNEETVVNKDSELKLLYNDDTTYIYLFSYKGDTHKYILTKKISETNGRLVPVALTPVPNQ